MRGAGSRSSFARVAAFDEAQVSLSGDADATMVNATLVDGKLDGAACQTCAGTGVVIEEVGGA